MFHKGTSTLIPPHNMFYLACEMFLNMTHAISMFLNAIQSSFNKFENHNLESFTSYSLGIVFQWQFLP
jgi:hypothetical protein